MIQVGDIIEIMSEANSAGRPVLIYKMEEEVIYLLWLSSGRLTNHHKNSLIFEFINFISYNNQGI